MNPDSTKNTQQKYEKIIVQKDYELTDILRKLKAAKSDYIVLTFAEESDLLVSPINLKVIQEYADDLEISLVAQIIQNHIGVRNAKLAGVTTFESASHIGDDLWDIAEQAKRSRQQRKEAKLKASSIVQPTVSLKEEEKPETVEIKNEVPKTAEVKSETPKAAEIKNEAPIAEVKESVEAPEAKTDFQKKIDSALEKSKSPEADETKEIIQEDDFVLAVDEDISTIKVPQKQQEKIIPQGSPSLIGRDFAAYDDSPLKGAEENVEDISDNTPTIEAKPESYKKIEPKTKENQMPLDKLMLLAKGSIDSLKAKIQKKKVAPPARSTFTGVKPSKSQSTSVIRPTHRAPERRLSNSSTQDRLKKIGLGVAGAIILFSLFVGFVAYKLLPMVTINIFIESKPIAVEKTFTGDLTTRDFDLEQGKVPIIREEVSKDLADSANATGKAARGTKAGGIATFKYFRDETVTLPAGTTITTSGKSFVTVSAITIIGPDREIVTVTATEVGGEYNLSAGNIFSVSGFSAADLTAENEAAFSGGSKEEYTVVSQEDVDNVVNRLKQDAFTDGENKLKDKHKNDGWEIITSTISSSVDGDVKTDVPVGSEKDIVNVSLKTKSSALYFKKSDITKVQEDVLLAEAEKNKLFDTDSDLKLTLSKDIESNITVESVNDTTVTVKMSLNGSVKPSVDKAELEEKLASMSWKEGLQYVDDLDFAAKESVVTFEPGYFPSFLKYFPSRQGRLLITVKEIQAAPAPETPQQ